MKAYDSLSTFADVTPTLTALSAIPTVRTVVFSNGTHAMVSNSVHRSLDLSPHAAVFTDIISVDSVRQFKPAPSVYLELAQKVGKSERLADIWLVSGNPFDVVGARSVGLNAIWVDRAGRGWIDAAVPRLRPTVVVRSLVEILDVVALKE